DLSAVKIEGSDTKYNASDLANGNLLLQKEADEAAKFTIPESDIRRIISSSDARVFPNPVTGSSFNVLFDGKKEGIYTIVLTDMTGRSIQSKSVSINKGIQSEKVTLVGKPAKGMYMVKVLDDQKQTVLTEKIVVQ